METRNMNAPTNEKFDNKDKIVESTESLKKKFQDLFTGPDYEGVNIVVTANTKKAEFNGSSITITINKEGEKRTTSATMYIVERKSAEAVIFVNDHNHSIIFSNISPNAVDKAEKYIIQFTQKNVFYMNNPKK